MLHFSCSWCTNAHVCSPQVDRYLKHQSETSCKRPRCWRHMAWIPIRARSHKHSSPAFRCSCFFPFAGLGLVSVFCLSGCVWESSLPRLHAIWFCGAPRKQKSPFSQMVSQISAKLCYGPEMARISLVDADVIRATLCCRPSFFLSWHADFRVTVTKTQPTVSTCDRCWDSVRS